MPIYNNVLFIHIPKTAGTYIEDTLKKFEKQQNFGYIKEYKSYKQHFTYNEYVNFYGKFFIDKLNIFTIIRDPYDRLYSAYKQKYSKSSDPKLIEMFKSNDFEDFVLNKLENILNNNNYYLGNIDHILPQTKFIENSTNLTIFPYKKIHNINNYLIINGIYVDINFVNINNNYLNLYNNDMKKKVMKVYKDDFLLYERYNNS